MADADHLDYRLRCHTKRTDLPADVLRDIGEAYAEIITLQRKLADIKQGFEGCCTACEPVGLLNQQLRKERDEARRLLKDVVDMFTAEHDALRAERDEVRQSYCSLMEAYRGGDGRVTANKLGWGYLFPRRPKKEDGK